MFRDDGHFYYDSFMAIGPCMAHQKLENELSSQLQRGATPAGSKREPAIMIVIVVIVIWHRITEYVTYILQYFVDVKAERRKRVRVPHGTEQRQGTRNGRRYSQYPPHPPFTVRVLVRVRAIPSLHPSIEKEDCVRTKPTQPLVDR
jgi:hypothetical protein